MTAKSKKRKATVKSPQNECVPYWTNITKDWSNQLLSCTYNAIGLCPCCHLPTR